MKRILFVLSFAFAMTATAAIDVQKLNQTLKNNNAMWVAKESHLTQLTKSETKRMLGLQGRPADVDFAVVDNRMSISAPTSLDWRNHMGQNWVSPMLDQGNCGSCVSFAAIGVMETQYRINSGLSNLALRLSTQQLFACGGGGCDWGWTPSSAANYLQRNGVTTEACFPYSSGATGKDVACNSGCADPNRYNLKLTSSSMPTRYSKDLNALKTALQKGPLVTTLTVYSDFMAYASGVYKHTTGKSEGGHAVSIVGYDDSKRALLIRNSWGEGWGENGFGWVSYDDISGVGDETWFYQLPSMSGAVAVETPVDYDYLSGLSTVRVRSSYSGTDSLTVSFLSESGMTAGTSNCSGNFCEQKVDVSKFNDGRYMVQATALDSSGRELGRSANQAFYIANQKPTMNISYTGKGVSLSSPLKGRVEFEISATTSTVPMSALEFHFKNLATGNVTSRSTYSVMDAMTMGWRTNLQPNGKYEIWFVGRLKTLSGQETVVESARMTVTAQN